MFQTILLVLTWKMVLYTSAIIGLCWALRRVQGQRDSLRVELAASKQDLVGARFALMTLQEGVKEWQDSAVEAARQAAVAQADADLIRKSYNDLITKIQTADVPSDPGAAIDWLADLGRTL